MSFVTDLFGGDNEYKPEGYKVDENAYEYGGAPGGADEAANRYRAQAEGAQNRQGVQVNYEQANQDRALGMEARAGQGRLASAMEARAMGQVPSIAQMQADRQMGQAAAEQQSAAQSARGPGGLAMAQQAAAANTANAQSSISGQAQINAASERERAEANAMGAHSQMRAGDAQSQGMSAQQSQFQAGMDDSQRGRNDAMTLGMTGFETGVRKDQMTGGMNRESQKSGNELQKQQMQAQIAEANAQRKSSNALGVVGAVAGAAAASSSDVRAKQPLSTWGTGQGLDDDGVGDMLGKLQADGIRAEVKGEERDAHLANTGGMQAVDFDAVSRLDKEDAAKAKAYEAHGVGVSAKDQASAARGEKAGKDEGGFARAMGAASKSLASAANRPAGHIGGGYTPPQLIPISGRSTVSDMGAKVDIGALSHINDLPAGAIQAPKKDHIKTQADSDVRAKEIVPIGPDAGTGADLKMTDEGRAFFAKETPGPLKASFSGPSSVSKSSASEEPAAKPSLSRAMKAKPAERKMTDEEAARLSKEADKMMGTIKAQGEAWMDNPTIRRLERGRPESGYETELTKSSEPAFERWMKRNAPPGDKGEDYDYRGAFADALDRSGDSEAHFTDKYKKPNHETFSDESEYAQFEPDKAGRWEGDKYIPPGVIRSDVTAKSAYTTSGMQAKQPLMMSDDEAKLRAAKAEAWEEGAEAGRRGASNRKDAIAKDGEVRAASRERELADRGDVSMRARHDGGTAASRRLEGLASRLRQDNDPMAKANRSQVASPYAYKPEFTPPEQEPGEPNVGPMAQNLAADPVARTAVKRGEGGMLMLDTNKLLKLHSGGIAHLQEENDELRGVVATLASRMRRPR